MRLSLQNTIKLAKGLQKQVDDLERKVANKPGVYSEMVIEHQEINDESITNQYSDFSLSSNKNVVESKAIDAVKSLISEEKDKANRRLNVIIHNVAESSASEGLIRKEHDMEQVKKISNKSHHLLLKLLNAFVLGRK